jgi:hypothetical protein
MERRGASECVDGGPRGARFGCLNNEVVQVAGYGAFGRRVRRGARDTILMERLSIGEQDAWERRRRGVFHGCVVWGGWAK